MKLKMIVKYFVLMVCNKECKDTSPCVYIAIGCTKIKKELISKDKEKKEEEKEIEPPIEPLFSLLVFG